jgi:hypothetical protein
MPLLTWILLQSWVCAADSIDALAEAVRDLASARLQLMADDSFNRKELESDPHYTREAAAAWVDSRSS